jgi:phosphoglycerate kinase
VGTTATDQRGGAERVNPLLDGLPLLADLGEVDGASVLVRVDFNVPLGAAPGGGGGRAVVTDEFRIRAALPTFEDLLARGASVTACTHLGRPGGHPDPRFEVAPVRDVLARLAPRVELLENLRFDPGEEGNDPAFVEKLVNGHDAYVNDAFGASHRHHASIVGPPASLPSAAGLLLQREVEVLGELLGQPSRPFVAVVGGAKLSDKLGVLTALVERVDAVVVGGGMAFTFLAAAGHSIGDSMVDADRIDECRALLQSGKDIRLPVDILALPASAGFGGGAARGAAELRTVGPDIPDGWRGLDIGPETVADYRAVIEGAATVMWNGPMGVFEDERFASGTKGVAEAVAANAGFTVVGGGDSAAALDQLGLRDRVSFVSTGGGAALELIEYGDLPGLAALRSAPNAPTGLLKGAGGSSPPVRVDE